jgi:hypothetical protein
MLKPRASRPSHRDWPALAMPLSGHRQLTEWRHHDAMDGHCQPECQLTVDASQVRVALLEIYAWGPYRFTSPRAEGYCSAGGGSTCAGSRCGYSRGGTRGDPGGVAPDMRQHCRASPARAGAGSTQGGMGGLARIRCWRESEGMPCLARRRCHRCVGCTAIPTGQREICAQDRCRLALWRCEAAAGAGAGAGAGAFRRRAADGP